MFTQTPNENFHCLHLQFALMAFLAMESYQRVISRYRLSMNQLAALNN